MTGYRNVSLILNFLKFLCIKFSKICCTWYYVAAKQSEKGTTISLKSVFQ